MFWASQIRSPTSRYTKESSANSSLTVLMGNILGLLLTIQKWPQSPEVQSMVCGVQRVGTGCCPKRGCVYSALFQKSAGFPGNGNELLPADNSLNATTFLCLLSSVLLSFQTVGTVVGRTEDSFTGSLTFFSKIC